MTIMRHLRAPLRRLPSNAAGQTIVTYAVLVCLFAAALVLATSIWNAGGIAVDRPAAEASR